MSVGWPRGMKPAMLLSYHRTSGYNSIGISMLDAAIRLISYGALSMPTPVEQWVEECAQLTHPKNIHWCDGSEAEYQQMIHDMLETGTLIELNQKEYPGCYLHRRDPTDVARTEHLT